MGFISGSGLQRGHSDAQFLTSVKQSLDAQKEHLQNELSKMQKQHKILHESTLNRYDERQRLLDGRHTKLDRRQAELTGTLQGLSEELQGQVRRVDLMEERMRVWRQQVEEEVRNVLSESSHQFQKAAADVRVAKVALEDSHKKHDLRIQRLEADTTGAESLLSLHQRVENMEVELPSCPRRCCVTCPGRLVSRQPPGITPPLSLCSNSTCKSSMEGCSRRCSSSTRQRPVWNIMKSG